LVLAGAPWSADATCEGAAAVSNKPGQACATDTVPAVNAKAKAAARHRIDSPPVLAITGSVRAITVDRKRFLRDARLPDRS
jgi:hypothetical protein